VELPGNVISFHSLVTATRQFECCTHVCLRVSESVCVSRVHVCNRVSVCACDYQIKNE